MAVDFDATFQTIHKLQQKLEELAKIVRVANNGKYENELNQSKDYTATEFADLVTMYTATKAELATLYQQLP